MSQFVRFVVCFDLKCIYCQLNKVLYKNKKLWDCPHCSSSHLIIVIAVAPTKYV